MTAPDSLFQDTIFRVLEAAPRGMTVERIRTQLAEAGAMIGKDEIVRCRFDQTDTHLHIRVPVARPTIVRDWLRDQVKYSRWNASRLLSWLLIEDETAGLDTEDEAESPDFLEILTFAARLESAAGKGRRRTLRPTLRVSSSGFYAYWPTFCVCRSAGVSLSVPVSAMRISTVRKSG